MESKVILVICKFNSFINLYYFFYYTIIILIIYLCFDIVHIEMTFDEPKEVTLTMKINKNDNLKLLGAISINIL
jgi:hypothetical protein